MINNHVSFRGNVFLVGAAKHHAKKDDIPLIKEYADKNNCDIMVHSVSNPFGTTPHKSYEAFTIKPDYVNHHNDVNVEFLAYNNGGYKNVND